MEIVKVYSQNDVDKITRKRTGERKIGESVIVAKNDWLADLKNSDCVYVLLGIAEDIGVRANFGRAGAATAVKPGIDSFLNQQSNLFLDASKVFVLGEINVDDLMDEAKDLDPKNKKELLLLRELVEKVDERVAATVKQIIAAAKIPIIVGGGHNNAFGNIKGAAQAVNGPINVINCDPHLDFRPLEGRHSGNGFSYAHDQKWMFKYSVLGMHEQYNNDFSITKFKENSEHLFYRTYESIFVREQVKFEKALQDCIGFVKDKICGVELDLDAITNVPSSAKTSSGITALQARQYVYQCAANLNPAYFHIAEGAPVLSHIKADNKTGKLISYLITDFIKGHSEATD